MTNQKRRLIRKRSNSGSSRIIGPPQDKTEAVFLCPGGGIGTLLHIPLHETSKAAFPTPPPGKIV
jgi:hypothetical protein